MQQPPPHADFAKIQASSCARILRCGFTLIELLIGILLIGILSALLIPSFQPNQIEILRDTAQLVASDLRLTRSLAVTNDTEFTITFDTSTNKYVFSQSGGATVLDEIPRQAFTRQDDQSGELTQYLEDLPSMGTPPQLYVVVDGTGARVNSIQFESLGNTSRAESTTIWITVGSDDNQRFISVTVDPVTGVSSVNEITAVAPVTLS